jgi:hypothetical protein
MAINTISYSTKSDINTTQTPATQKVSASDMNEIKTVVNANANLMGDLTNLTTTVKTDIVSAINSIKTTINSIEKPILLWENPNPISSFSPQQVTLSSNDYDTIEIYYLDYRGTLNMSSVRAVKGNNISMPTIIMNNGQGYIGVRTCEFINGTTLDFNYANAIIQNNVINVATNVIDWCIPIYIVGYKTNIL